MASKIRVLSDHTINKIAAGEVIENPSSVVKELVENSLDADSNDICIEIKSGGRQLIRISDNGCGMNPDDALLCLERHATSKIREVEEIREVNTMGFRGEAMPSIASISKFMILTCPAPEKGESPSPIGTMVIVDGGKIVNCAPAARAPGTTIEVKDLFFNVPVRKKFLKSPAVDANEIHKVVSLLALGHPEVKFQLISDGKSLLMAPSFKGTSFVDSFNARIGAVLGQDFLHNTTTVEEKREAVAVQGIVGQPGYTRHNRTGQYLFINRRAVVSPLVAFAVKDGYGHALPTGRHPVFVLHLTIDGNLVDVNVHPQKREVRLRQEQQIKDLIIHAVQNTLRHEAPTTVETPIPVSPVFARAFQLPEQRFTPPSEGWTFRPKPAPYMGSTPTLTHQVSITPPKVIPSLPLATESVIPPKVLATLPRFIILDATSGSPFLEKGFTTLAKGGLFLIDQKAAHARVIYEKLTLADTGPLAQQTLLIPHQIEVSPFEASSLRQSLPILCQAGINIHEFGQNTFLVDAIPQIFGNSNLELLISDIIHDLRDTHSDQILEREIYKKIALAAGRAASGNDRRLSIDEASSLTNQLAKCRHPYQCPNGKPTVVQIPPEDLSKWFQKCNYSRLCTL